MNSSTVLFFLKDYWVLLSAVAAGIIFIAKFIYLTWRKISKIDSLATDVEVLKKDVRQLKNDMSFVKGKSTAIENLLKTLISQSRAAQLA